jgi:hypothetical protein
MYFKPTIVIAVLSRFALAVSLQHVLFIIHIPILAIMKT